MAVLSRPPTRNVRRDGRGVKRDFETITLAAPLIIENDEALVRLSRDNPGDRIEREEDA